MAQLLQRYKYLSDLKVGLILVLVNDPGDKGIGEPQECTNTVWGDHKYALMWQGAWWAIYAGKRKMLGH